MSHICRGFAAPLVERSPLLLSLWLERRAPDVVPSDHEDIARFNKDFPGAPHRHAEMTIDMDPFPTLGWSEETGDGTLAMALPVGYGGLALLRGVRRDESFEAYRRKARAFAAAHSHSVLDVVIGGDGTDTSKVPEKSSELVVEALRQQLRQVRSSGEVMQALYDRLDAALRQHAAESMRLLKPGVDSTLHYLGIEEKYWAERNVVHPVVDFSQSEAERSTGTGTDHWKNVLDHMLVRLAAPLCTTETAAAPQRPARILVLGDSHTYSFYGGTRGYPGTLAPGTTDDADRSSGCASSPSCGWSNYMLCPKASVTAYGLTNNKSHTGAGRFFADCARRSRDVDFVALMVGEVDLRFLAWHRAEKKGVTVLEQIRESSANLIKYVEDAILPLGFSMQQIVLLGAPLKCPHSAITEMTKGLLLHRDTSLAALRFNSELKSMCRIRGCRFANPVDDVFDYASGEVDPFFWTTPLDFHCSPVRSFFFWHRAIQRATDLGWCSRSEDGKYHAP